MNLALVFSASFAFIFLKAFQQRNVAFDNYVWVMPTSFAMALVEIFVIANIARNGWSWLLVGDIGLGSGSGALLAMYIHRTFVK
jgi:hypothetical protein